ncbi:MAG: NAD(+) diphosphatase [Lachnospiraceae bacterium]|nr:NAD(+) diphosphatase [Lachnospiraceae bacterium]
MIQDIYPSKLNTEYFPYEMTDKDILVSFNREGEVLLGKKGDTPLFPKLAVTDDEKIIYLFSVDDDRYFLLLDDANYPEDGAEYYSLRSLRRHFTGKEVFAIFTAYHLWKWYTDNVFCGKCGEKLVFDQTERALRCAKCGNVVYPRINPAVIVGVLKGDTILVTRYKTGYNYNALVAGFTEIGETLEETVAREVMEETGVKVKNIRYYKSQPWGIAQDVLVGFFCEADGDGEIHMDENELKFAQWVTRDELELQPDNISLTNEMMMLFKDGRL